MVAEGRQDAVDDRTVTTFAYVRVEECANIAAILSYLRKDPPKVLMMFCEKSESAKVWGGATPSQKKCPDFRGGTWREKSLSHRSLLDFSCIASL